MCNAVLLGVANNGTSDRPSEPRPPLPQTKGEKVIQERSLFCSLLIHFFWPYDDLFRIARLSKLFILVGVIVGVIVLSVINWIESARQVKF